MDIRCQSSLWKLQTKFHILNHYLVTDPDTGLPWRQGPLMYKIIELLQEAFGVDSDMGISPGTMPTPGPTVAPFFIGKGTFGWANIFDVLMVRPGSPDIHPTYYHTDDENQMMLFNVFAARGEDKSLGGVAWQYHTGNKNLENVVEGKDIIPNEFGNYVWAVGKGGPNSGKVAVAQDVGGTYGSDEVGVFMRYHDASSVETLGTDSVNSGGVKPISKAELRKAKIPRKRYDVTVSPAGGENAIYYDVEYTLGDVIRLDADKGALNVVNKRQRIFEVDLSMSMNNMETATVVIADDLEAKVINFEGNGPGVGGDDPAPIVAATEAPENLSLPVIWGVEEEGSILNVTPGAWEEEAE
jgi:hypothetical protein